MYACQQNACGRYTKGITAIQYSATVPGEMRKMWRYFHLNFAVCWTEKLFDILLTNTPVITDNQHYSLNIGLGLDLVLMLLMQ